MKAFFWLRLLAWIKRAALALESIASSQAAIAEATVEPTRRKPRAKVTDVFTPSVRERNEAWQAQKDEDNGIR